MCAAFKNVLPMLSGTYPDFFLKLKANFRYFENAESTFHEILHLYNFSKKVWGVCNLLAYLFLIFRKSNALKKLSPYPLYPNQKLEIQVFTKKILYFNNFICKGSSPIKLPIKHNKIKH